MKVKCINLRRAKRLPIGTMLVSRRPMQDVYDRPVVYVKTNFGWFSAKRITSTNQWVHADPDHWELRKEVVSYGKWYVCTPFDVQEDSRCYGGLMVEPKKFDMSLVSNEWHQKDHRIYLDARDVAIRRFLGEM